MVHIEQHKCLPWNGLTKLLLRKYVLEHVSGLRGDTALHICKYMMYD